MIFSASGQDMEIASGDSANAKSLYANAIEAPIPEQFTIPLGTEVEIDATAGTMTLLESGVT